jgi:sterol desaturase/sphingolipid hydroxylase (fatty acid hydroxylase superfamily)
VNLTLLEPAVFLGGGALTLIFQRPNAKPVPWRTRLAEVGSVLMALGISTWVRSAYVLPAAGRVNPLRVLLGLLVTDFAFYWLHRWCHGPLWRTHKNHHAGEHFDTGIAFRDSAVHLVVFAALFGVLHSGCCRSAWA